MDGGNRKGHDPLNSRQTGKWESLLTVVISRSRGRHPEKRRFEDALAAELAGQTQCSVLVVPPLTDLRDKGPVWSQLQDSTGDLLVLGWLRPRAMQWLLARHGITDRLVRGRVGSGGAPSPQPATGRPAALRRVACWKLDPAPPVSVWGQRVRRIVRAPVPAEERPPVAGKPVELDEPSLRRRWFPVIDYSRCTHCMECIDFCLFGVYGIDANEKILVEQPDLCRPGCPACSRVCPENAIMFPHHSAPAIAGARGETQEKKVDLSAIFGETPSSSQSNPASDTLMSQKSDPEQPPSSPPSPGTTDRDSSTDPHHGQDDWLRQLEEL